MRSSVNHFVKNDSDANLDAQVYEGAHMCLRNKNSEPHGRGHPPTPLERRPSESLFRRYFFIFNCILTLANIALFWACIRKADPSLTQCDEALSAFSPALPYLEYETVTFASFTASSQYKGAPSPEIDAAWDRLDQSGYVPISKSDLLNRLNKDESYVSLEDGRYLGSLEVYHQLHCLNLIRKYTYEGYYRSIAKIPIPFQDSNATLRRHVDHCIDYLREAIMCTGDVSVYTSYWVENRELPWPDFQVEHVCRQWDSIEKYAQAVGDTIELPTKPKNAVQYPHPVHSSADKLR